VTAAIVFLSKRGNTLPGILPLFPTFALISLLVIGAKGDQVGFRETCLAGAKTIAAYLAFLDACYLTVGRVDYRIAIGWARRLAGCRAFHLPGAAEALTTILNPEQT
jgi:membrane protein GlpM